MSSSYSSGYNETGLLTFPAKIIRAEVIKEYVGAAGYRNKCVCFSCGNASKALTDMCLDVLDISPTGDFTANRWYTPDEIHRLFPDRFDATSGHLPLHLMIKIADRFKLYLDNNLDTPLSEDVTYKVPTGSGETILCLQMAYPKMHFVPIYNMDSKGATKYEQLAPLNSIIENFYNPQY